MRRADVFALLLGAAAILAVIVAVVSTALDERKAREAEFARLTEDCTYLGNEILPGFTYRNIHRWDCGTYIVERSYR